MVFDAKFVLAITLTQLTTMKYSKRCAEKCIHYQLEVFLSDLIHKSRA